MNDETCWRCGSDEVAEHGLCVACLEETLEERTLIADTLHQHKLGTIDDQTASEVYRILAREHVPVTKYVEDIIAQESI